VKIAQCMLRLMNLCSFGAQVPSAFSQAMLTFNILIEGELSVLIDQLLSVKGVGIRYLMVLISFTVRSLPWWGSFFQNSASFDRYLESEAHRE